MDFHENFFYNSCIRDFCRLNMLDIKDYDEDTVNSIIDDSVNCLELIEVKISAALKMYKQVRGDDVSKMAREMVNETIAQVNSSISFKDLSRLIKYKRHYEYRINSFFINQPNDYEFDFIELCRFYSKNQIFDLDVGVLYLPFANPFNTRTKRSQLDDYSPDFDQLLECHDHPVSFHDMSLLSKKLEHFEGNHDLFGVIKYLDPECFRAYETIMANPGYKRSLAAFFLSKFVELFKNKKPSFDYPSTENTSSEFSEIFDQFDLDSYSNFSIKNVINRVTDDINNELPNHIQPNSQIWHKYIKAIENLDSAILEFSSSNKNIIDKFIGSVDPNLLFKSIYDFLIQNNMNPLGIPTIRELGEKPGGFALVKKISNVGGLRKIRDGYIEWSSAHLRKEQSLLSKERRKVSKEDYLKSPKKDGLMGILDKKLNASDLIGKSWAQRQRDLINESLSGNIKIIEGKDFSDDSGPEEK